MVAETNFDLVKHDMLHPGDIFSSQEASLIEAMLDANEDRSDYAESAEVVAGYFIDANVPLTVEQIGQLRKIYLEQTGNRFIPAEGLGSFGGNWKEVG